MGPARGSCAAERQAVLSAIFALVLAAVGLALPGAARADSASTGGCSWQLQAGSGGIDLFDVDTDAAYWVTTFTASAGSGLTITGSFPAARFMSFAAYDPKASVTPAGLYDAEIAPSGGVNPFQPGVVGGGAYTVTVLPQAPPADPAPNTLYAGANTGDQVVVVYRVYAPDESSSPAGGVPLPAVTVTQNGLPVSVGKPCVVGQGGSVADARHAALSAAAPSVAAGAAPSWSSTTIPNDFPNPDSAYLITVANVGRGPLVVVQAQMPAFPDTAAGQPPWAPGQQVRYWSMCVGNPLTVTVACVPDQDAVLVGDEATFVISPAADQPPNATAANGVNWMPWAQGSLVQLLYRQILAQPSFSEAIDNVPAGESLQTAMGPYYPQIAYCTEAEFTAAGAAGCLGTG